MNITPDMANGFFEFIGAVLIFASIRKLLTERRVAGVHWAPVLFFTMWGAWNLFYYPSLGQWYSFVGACLMVFANFIWLCLMIRYWDEK